MGWFWCNNNHGLKWVKKFMTLCVYRLNKIFWDTIKKYQKMFFIKFYFGYLLGILGVLSDRFQSGYSGGLHRNQSVHKANQLTLIYWAAWNMTGEPGQSGKCIAQQVFTCSKLTKKNTTTKSEICSKFKIFPKVKNKEKSTDVIVVILLLPNEQISHLLLVFFLFTWRR